MLIRTKKGVLVEISKKDFTTDKAYYNYIMSII